MNSRTSVTVSASECAASDSIAEEWLIRPPTSLATAMPRLASPATTTVPVDSPPDSPEASSVSACVRVGTGSDMAASVPHGCRAQPRGSARPSDHQHEGPGGGDRGGGQHQPGRPGAGEHEAAERGPGRDADVE